MARFGADLKELDFSEQVDRERAQTSDLSGKLIPRGEPFYVAKVGTMSNRSQRRLSLAEYEVHVLGLRDVSTAERKSLAKKGSTFKGESWPIANCGDVEAAHRAIGRANPSQRSAIKSYINGKAKALGCNIPPLT